MRTENNRVYFNIMANNKSGFEYYSTDTDRYQDYRIKRLKKNLGCVGIAVYDFILCEVYRVRGYYLEWDENVSFDIADYFGLEEQMVEEVVRFCCEVGLFDKSMFERKSVITSLSIQRRYLDMSVRAKRKDFKIQEEYKIIPEESHIIPEESPKTQEVSNKVKESKVKKRKEEIKEENSPLFGVNLETFFADLEPDISNPPETIPPEEVFSEPQVLKPPPPAPPSAPVKKRQEYEIWSEAIEPPELRMLVLEWMLHKRSRGETYKNQKSFSLMVEKLRKFSKGDVNVAREIIEDAMSKNYAGFFEPKNYQPGYGARAAPPPKTPMQQTIESVEGTLKLIRLENERNS